ncbi:MAG: alkaline phosphatase family protein [Leptospirales bacterium]
MPAYTFIEPRVFYNHTDMHPPCYNNPLVDPSILAGEELLNKIYEDLFIHGKKKESTLLIVTFDEHGGCYDHVYPPSAVAPMKNPDYPLEKNFKFTQLGARVPTIMISPWIKEKTVFRSSEPKKVFDHTSVIKTLCNWQPKLNGKHLTDRDRAAPDFSPVLNGEKIRSKMPRYTAREYVPGPEPHAGLTFSAKIHRFLMVLQVKLIRAIPPRDISFVKKIFYFFYKIVRRIIKFIHPKKLKHLSGMQQTLFDIIMKH